MNIYSKTGDTGETGLFGGPRVPKSVPRIQAYGTVDELNSVLGWALCQIRPESALSAVVDRIVRIQNELFVLGSDLATPIDAGVTISRMESRHVTSLENEIDAMQADLPPLRQFILPGGSEAASRLHVARTVARRAERALVAFGEESDYNPEALKYLNRLSDWLFVLARLTNQKLGVDDVVVNYQ